MNKYAYNGWTNYETWIVNLWISNDSGSYDYWHEKAREFSGDHKIYDFSRAIKDEFEENDPTGENGVYSDLMSAAMSEVNWFEIAKAIIEENDENENDSC